MSEQLDTLAMLKRLERFGATSVSHSGMATAEQCLKALESVEAELQQTKQALQSAKDLISSELTMPHGAQAFRDVLSEIEHLGEAK